MTLEATRIPRGYAQKPKDGGNYREGKDGKFYLYADVSVANRRFLQAKFELDKIKEVYPMNKTPRKKKRKASVVTPLSGTLTPSRQSRRLQQVSAENPTGMSAEDLLEEELALERRKQAKKIKRSKHRTIELTPEDRAKLQDLPDWLEKFDEFLMNVDKISDPNRRNVMRQTELMTSGVGVTYRHWKEGVCFNKGVKVDLSFDFEELYDEAVDMESEHGRDLGNGWLMRHPITKLKKFQEYLKEESETK